MCVYICNQSYCLVEWFKIPVDQRTLSCSQLLSFPQNTVVVEVAGKLIQLHLVHGIPAGEEGGVFHGSWEMCV